MFDDWNRQTGLSDNLEHWSRRQRLDAFVRAFPRTETGIELAHKIIVGKPGSGKSSLLRHEIKRDIDAGDTYVWIGDPSGALIDDVMADNHRHEKRFEIIDLQNPDRVFGLRLLDPPTATEPGKVRGQQEEAIGRVIEFLGGGSGRDLDITKMPLVFWGWHTALALVQRFPGGASERLIPFALIPDSAEQEILLDWHPDRKLAAEVWEINRQRSQRGNWYGPAQRMSAQTIEHPVIDAMLSGPAQSFEEWVPQKKVVLFRGAMGLPVALQRAAMGWGRTKSAQAAFRLYDATGKPHKTAIYAEEADWQGVGLLDARYMSVGRKAGLKYTLVYPNVPTSEMFQTVRQVAQQLVVFQQGTAQATEAMAREALAFAFNSKKVKEVRQTERTINRGVKRDTVTTRSAQFDNEGQKRGETEQTHFLSTPDIETVLDEQNVYFASGEQLGDMMREIRGLQVRQRLVIDGNGVKRDPVEEVKELWSSEWSKKRYLRQAVKRIQARPHYFTATFAAPAMPKPPKTPSVNGSPAQSKSLFERLGENGTLP